MHIQLFCLFVLFQYIESNAVDLSCKDIRAFVDGHNSRRLLVAKGKVAGQPAASKMNSVIWDEELATKAKKWAEQEDLSYNLDKTVGSGRFTVGENIFKIKYTGKNLRLEIETVLDSWFNGSKGYDWGIYPTKPGHKHYTQMVWSKSINIGCGISQYIKDGVEYHVVCNYGPGGNINGKKPYEEGVASNKLVCSGNCSHRYGLKC